ncbi:MAG: type II secretion system F family protein, partial [Halochromatium sp.]
MPRYYYKAVRLDGEEVEGEQEAADEAALIARLQAEGLLPLKTRSAGGLTAQLARRRQRGLQAKEIESLTRQLATLLESGLTLDRSLGVLAELTPEEHVTRVLSDLQERVRGGATFSSALAAQNDQFPKLYINMVRAGEASGALEQVL